MQGLTVELRQLIGQRATAAGVFEVRHATDLVMVKTDAMEAARHYGYVAHDKRGKFLALPQYQADFPAPVRGEIERRISELAGRDVGCVQAPQIKQAAPASAVDPVDDDE